MRRNPTEESQPAINPSDFSSFSIVEQAEGIAAESSAARLRYRQSRCHGNSRICSIPATLQDIWTQKQTQDSKWFMAFLQLFVKTYSLNNSK